MPTADVLAACQRAATAVFEGMFVFGAGRPVGRLLAHPGKGNPFVLTLVRINEGEASFETRVPVRIPPEAEEAALRLCLMLSGPGRTAVVLDGERPLVRAPQLLGALAEEAATHALASALAHSVNRAAAVIGPFQRVAQGASPSDVLAEVSEFELPWTDPWSSPPPRGSAWEGLLEGMPEFPPGIGSALGYTDAEFRASRAVVFKTGSGEVDAGVERCSGPALIHADGVVECYRCSDPGSTPHLPLVAGSCIPGMRIGDGHVCERCG